MHKITQLHQSKGKSPISGDFEVLTTSGFRLLVTAFSPVAVDLFDIAPKGWWDNEVRLPAAADVAADITEDASDSLLILRFNVLCVAQQLCGVASCHGQYISKVGSV